MVGSYRAIFLYGVLGLCAGILAVFFVRYSDGLHQRVTQILQRVPRWLLMASVGIAVGVAGFFFHDILGIGYEGIYARKLRQTGFRLNTRADFSLLRKIPAREIMQPGNDNVLPQ